MKKQASNKQEQERRGAPPPALHVERSIEEVLGLHLHTTGEKIKYGIYTSLPIGLGAEVLGAQGGGILFAVVAGVIVGYWSEEVEWFLNKLRHRTGGKDGNTRLTWLLLGKHRMQHPRPAPDDEPDEAGTVEAGEETSLDDIPSPYNAVEQALALSQEEFEGLFHVAQASDTGGIVRLTVEQIVRNTKPNSYLVWVGRSLTKEGNPAVQIKFYKQHFRFMGASQRGKSSMLAAFLDIITQTHDHEHVRLILLDKENQTGNLFAHLPHVLSMKRPDGSLVKLHARSVDEVVAYLIHTVAIMKHRYTLSKACVLELPIILVYVEEFLAVKNELRARIAQAKTKEGREQAQSDYATFVYCIEVLAQEGLKARVQLLLCAQVEYRDDDFVEALVNVQCGFSFCVRPKAAQAAGFANNELLKRNAKENKVGQAVVETPDCNDLVLAPDYDLEARLLAFEKMQVRQPGEPTHLEDYARMRAQETSDFYAQDEEEDARTYARTNAMRPPEKTTHQNFDERTPDSPRLTEEQITQFIGAYKVSGNKDKSLYACGANTRYRAHADEIIREHGLKKEGA